MNFATSNGIAVREYQTDLDLDGHASVIDSEDLQIVLTLIENKITGFVRLQE